MQDYIEQRFNLELLFWWRFARETMQQQHMMPLLEARLRKEHQSCRNGLENLPSKGNFVLAVNHYNGRRALDVGAVVLQAVAQVRPDAVAKMLIIVGSRQRQSQNALITRFISCIYSRWSAHMLRVTLYNQQPSVVGLREWSKRDQPVFVFPEGRARLQLGPLRHGTGRWLSRLDTPVIPVGVWWKRNEGWHVCFGKALRWSHRTELRDIQLGLAMAALLPPELAPDWQQNLERWRAIHAKELEHNHA